MGQCLSLDQEELKARAKSDVIDRQLQSWAKEEQNVIKILLLGAAESGKSTLVKQMKIIHHDGFSNDELMSFKPAVLDNLLGSMKYVLTGMGLLRINLENPKYRSHAEKVLTCICCFDKKQNMYQDVYASLKYLWQDRGVRLAVSRGYEYELNDSAIYYFENMDRICHHNFVPNAKDVLRARVRTTGILETCFKINNFVIRMFDVGGQRSERRKWIHCFGDVKAVLFVAALSCYDMYLFEDPDVNRLEESLNLFRGICNNRFFRETCMILFLNKVDLFKDKIRHSERHLRNFFPDYRGKDRDFDSAAHFIRIEFQRQNHVPSKVIYPHFTTATDTSNIQVVFQVVMDSILKDNLRSSTLL
ncbi:guanine nucleotide-binding protein G(o) subunit alpha-like [Mytilus californianus]|uniref:guanine nucleotide-binding protein G(o) subunit alpha-like n=1 Tax=Mytilus californianus TaxID=6549 RepID=UPI0022480061|nr:guanine nucleotide-binding protein G(o) subunit alpha-like [Mytilus californianus]XP_052072066.1 guanine nucleotide-binding protein G(o) subunit alpha-like [Mytilus californianus]XP_052072067.1 guanine nucleotide-binding protein G(o) subunit alpha-like [Mytilus californianus]